MLNLLRPLLYGMATAQSALIVLDGRIDKVTALIVLALAFACVIQEDERITMRRMFRSEPDERDADK